MFLGARYYFYLRKQQQMPSPLSGSAFYILIGCLLGAGLGNKAVYWIEMPHLWATQSSWLNFFTGGQSMVGGLVGALLGVEIAKRLCGYTQSTGDLFVFPVLLALMIGRVGCFLAGLNDGTFGVATGLPWGVDFGDGISRHPTQLYEIAFAGTLCLVLKNKQAQLAQTSGLMFKILFTSYLLWRFGIDFLKPVPYTYPFGLSGIQWVCMLALMLYVPLNWRGLKHMFYALEVN
jgi:prolipoprotein diacylglyceryltransferase